MMEQEIFFRPDWEAVGRAVLDHALALPGIDKDRVAYIGVSMGGYLAPRVVANSGLFVPRQSAWALFSLETLMISGFNERVKELQDRGFTVIVEETKNPLPDVDLLREAYVLPKDGPGVS